MRKFILLCFVIALCAPLLAQQPVSADLAIQITRGEQHQRAREKDKLQAGDRLRVVVRPHFSAHVYVVYSDGKAFQVLNDVAANPVSPQQEIMLPSPTASFEIDGKSRREGFTLICSKEAVPALEQSAQLTYKQWLALERAMIDGSRIALTEKAAKPIAIAGNVRGVSESNGKATANPAALHIAPVTYSGKNKVVKRYRFRVQN